GLIGPTQRGGGDQQTAHQNNTGNSDASFHPVSSLIMQDFVSFVPSCPPRSRGYWMTEGNEGNEEVWQEVTRRSSATRPSTRRHSPVARFDNLTPRGTMKAGPTMPAAAGAARPVPPLL